LPAVVAADFFPIKKWLWTNKKPVGLSPGRLDDGAPVVIGVTDRQPSKDTKQLNIIQCI